MQVTVNGEPRDLPDGATVADLLCQLGLTGPLAVELNRQLCSKPRHADTILKNGDQLEIVTIVGGG